MNPLITALYIIVLPANVTFVSTSNPDITCQGPIPATAAGPLFTNHSDHNFLLCTYTGASTALGAGQTLSNTITVSVDSLPGSFNAYAFTYGGPADADSERFGALLSTGEGGDYLDRLMNADSNNAVLGAYTAPNTESGGGSNGSGNASIISSGGSLSETGQTAWVALPLITLVISLALLARLTTKKKDYKNLRVIAVIVAVLSIAAGGAIVLQHKNDDSPSKAVVSNGDDDNVPAEDKVSRLPKDAKSEVCDTLSADEVSTAVGQKIDQALVSAPTKKSKDSTVSACIYITSKDEPRALKSVSILKTNYQTPAQAAISFDLLNRIPNKNKVQLDASSYYDDKVAQLIVIKQSSLFVVNLSKTELAKLDKKTYTNLKNIL